MNKIVLGAALCASLVGCATKPVALAPGAVSESNKRVLGVAVHEQPSFTAMTAGNAMFGMLGALASIGNGQDIVRKNQIPDPAEAIAEGLSEQLQAKLGLAGVQRTSRLVTDASPQALATLFPEADLVLHIESTGWGFGYYPMDWTHYSVSYGVVTRLIDTKKHEVIATSACTADTRDAPNPPSYDALMGGGAAGLKSRLEKAGRTCLQKAKTETYAL